jgi:general secretion pathway protein M
MAGPVLQMNARERRLVTLLGFVGAFILICAVPIAFDAYLRSLRGDNDELRQALSDVQDARQQVREGQARKDAIVARYGRKAPALAGYLEQTARQQKLEVTESTPLPDVPHGKRYSEHGTNIHLKKAGMLPIARFLEAIEKSGYPIAVTRLNVRKRSGENDSYDVEIGASSYDRSEAAAAAGTSAGSSKP